MKESKIKERLEELKKLHDAGFIDDEKLLEKLDELEKLRKANLKESIEKQKVSNLNLIKESFSITDIELLINNSMI